MIADLKPYPEYKATAQAWLGDVPKHWSVVPNRALFAEMKDRNHPDEEMLSVTITRGIVRQKALLEGGGEEGQLQSGQVGLQTRSAARHCLQHSRASRRCRRCHD